MRVCMCVCVMWECVCVEKWRRANACGRSIELFGVQKEHNKSFVL